MTEEIIDPLMIPDVFVSSIGKIEATICGTCYRFYYCVRQRGDLIVVAKHVVPAMAIPAMIAYRRFVMGDPSQQKFPPSVEDVTRSALLVQ